MAKTRKIPLRKSVVSNEIIDKRDLLRIVKNKEGQVFIDPTGKANGRGAYIKLDNEEALQAKKKRVFNRSFSMEVDEAFYDELIAYVDHKVKRRELGLEQTTSRKSTWLGSASRTDYLWGRISGQSDSRRQGQADFSGK